MGANEITTATFNEIVRNKDLHVWDKIKKIKELRKINPTWFLCSEADLYLYRMDLLRKRLQEKLNCKNSTYKYVTKVSYKFNDSYFANIYRLYLSFDDRECVDDLLDRAYKEAGEGNDPITNKKFRKLAGKYLAPYIIRHKTETLPAIEKNKKLRLTHIQENKELQELYQTNRILKWNIGDTTFAKDTLYHNDPARIHRDESVVIGNYAFVATEEVEKDWNYYSKSYKFPKVTVLARSIDVYKKGKGLVKTYQVDRWTPGFMVEIVAQHMKIEKPAVAKSLRRFQSNKFYDVKRTKSCGGFAMYKQLFGKHVIGYVAYNNHTDLHFHATTAEEALNGLKEKIAKFEKQTKIDQSTILSAEFCNKNYGFCYPGMSEFAEAIGASITDHLSVKELKDRIEKLKDKSILAKYRRELKAVKLI